jgi:hypothetical protein
MPLEIIRIIVQLRAEPSRRPTPYNSSGFFHRGPTFLCFASAQIKVAMAAIDTMTEDTTAGSRYLKM